MIVGAKRMCSASSVLTAMVQNKLQLRCLAGKYGVTYRTGCFLFMIIERFLGQSKQKYKTINDEIRQTMYYRVIELTIINKRYNVIVR